MKGLDLNFLRTFGEVVHAHYYSVTRLDFSLLKHSRHRNFPLEPAFFYRWNHPTETINLVEDRQRISFSRASMVARQIGQVAMRAAQLAHRATCPHGRKTVSMPASCAHDHR